MIIRILADGQYRLDEGQSWDGAAIARLDDALVQELEANDETGFHATLGQLIEQVHAAGRAVPLDELVPSDMIVPAEDMTPAECWLLSRPASVEILAALPARANGRRHQRIRAVYQHAPSCGSV